MADVVNLNDYRKRCEKGRKAQGASQSRIRHGRTKAERNQTAQELERARAELDGKRRPARDGSTTLDGPTDVG